MSYDLLAFDANAAPRDRAAFKEWWAVQSQWGEGHGYNDPSVTTPELQRFYELMTSEFRDIGSLSDDEDADSKTSDYSIGMSVIYVAFPWSEADVAYDKFRESVVMSGVGFYEVSMDQGAEELFFPGDTLRAPSNGLWRQVAADFRSGDVGKYIPQSLPTEEPPKRRWFDIFRRSK